jgi:solute carrier family 45 protein 1/2/4
VSIISLAWAGVTGHWAAALFFPAERIEAAGTITRICAVLSICMLGLAVQPLQCGLRALVLDLCPAEQQVRAQAWAVRFSGMGQILGCAAGVLGVPSTSSLGGLWTFRILSVVAILAVNITAIVTCLGVQEPSRLRLHHRQRSHLHRSFATDTKSSLRPNSSLDGMVYFPVLQHKVRAALQVIIHR